MEISALFPRVSWFEVTVFVSGSVIEETEVHFLVVSRWRQCRPPVVDWAKPAG